MLRSHTPGLYHLFVAACASTGFRPTIAEEVTSPQQAFELAQDGVGVAVLPFGVCTELPPEVKYFPISGLDPLPLIFMYRRDDSGHAEILGDLADLLQKKCLDYAS